MTDRRWRPSPPGSDPHFAFADWRLTRTAETRRDRNGRLIMDCNPEAQALGRADIAERLLDGYDR